MQREILARYSLERDCKHSTLEQYRLAMACFARFLGRNLQPGDWTDDTVNAFLRSMAETHRPYSVSQRRANLLVLWRFAAELGLVDRLPVRVRRIRKPELLRPTWTPAEIRRLIDVAEGLQGKFRSTHILRSGFWGSWVRAAYDTGLRSCDMWLLEIEDVLNSGGRLCIVQVKTSRIHRIRMRPETVEAIRRFTRQADRRYIWPRLWEHRHFSSAFRKVAALAGLDGSPKTLRRSSATEIERLWPGLAWQHLGHCNPSIAARHYLGDRAYADRPLPPLE